MSWISINVRRHPVDRDSIIAQALYGGYTANGRYERVLADVTLDSGTVPAHDAESVAWFALSAIMDELVKSSHLRAVPSGSESSSSRTAP